MRLTEEQIRDRNPWDYDRLTEEYRKRYKDFKIVQRYHDIRRRLLKDKRFGEIRYLDPGNTRSSKKPFFNPNILKELDKHFTKK